MRLLLALLLVLALPASALAAKATLPDVEDEVMCVTCGTALNISQAPSADREREFIRRRIAEGLDKDQIKDRLVAEYGPKVLAEPHQRTSWIVPLAAGIAGDRHRRVHRAPLAADVRARSGRRGTRARRRTTDTASRPT